MPLEWDREGRDWPLREHSRFVAAGPVTFHVQRLGVGPPLLLIHGTAASTHSWRDVAPLLAQNFDVISLDLPGHGFTRGVPPGGLTLGGMAGALARLTQELGVQPVLVAAHSAGTAIACRMALDGTVEGPIVGFGAALLPMGGAAAPIFSGLAKLLLLNPFAASWISRIARRPGRVDRFLVQATGSTIDRRGAELYARLFASPGHCAGAVEMMARWDLAALAKALPKLPVPLHLAHGTKDSAVPIAEAERAARSAGGDLQRLAGLGHLAHEEQPEQAAGIVRAAAGERR